ncbi:MAG: hemerythrin domain-containing protein [Conexivisphaerales archaeon]|nr:hemerythrin domain-containing protein [Conexivisphaerales archaeon]
MVLLTAELQGEHIVILENLEVLESLGPFDRELDFLARYVDGCHHAKEELALFPVLTSRGLGEEALIEEALEQHREARRLIGEMRENHSRFTASRYIELIKSHVEMEDSVTFAVAEYALPDDEKEEILSRMRDLSAQRCVGFEDAARDLSVHRQGIYRSRVMRAQ